MGSVGISRVAFGFSTGAAWWRERVVERGRAVFTNAERTVGLRRHDLRVALDAKRANGAAMVSGDGCVTVVV